MQQTLTGFMAFKMYSTELDNYILDISLSFNFVSYTSTFCIQNITSFRKKETTLKT
jgi:hypothetical protein